MYDCKAVRGIMEDFEAGKMSLKTEEEFIKHICQCKDCREELEIFYIFNYGLEEETNINTKSKSKYDSYIDSYDFDGLIEHKIYDSIRKCKFERSWASFNRIRYFFISLCMTFTALGLFIILFID